MPPSDPDAERWLAAAAARIEDDEPVLSSLSDDDVDALLRAEGARPSGVAAEIRRRIRTERPRGPRLRWVAAGGLFTVLAAGLVWLLLASPQPADDLLAYRADLEAYASVPVKADAPLATGARWLLLAAEAVPPDTALARRAATLLVRASSDAPDAAFFAALAYRLAEDEANAQRWFARVPPASRYAPDAAAQR